MTLVLDVLISRLNPSLEVTEVNASTGWTTTTVARNRGSEVCSQLLSAAAYENRMISPWNSEKAAHRHTFTGSLQRSTAVQVKGEVLFPQPHPPEEIF